MKTTNWRRYAIHWQHIKEICLERYLANTQSTTLFLMFIEDAFNFSSLNTLQMQINIKIFYNSTQLGIPSEEFVHKNAPCATPINIIHP
jgi:hypothetical protein